MADISDAKTVLPMAGERSFCEDSTVGPIKREASEQVVSSQRQNVTSKHVEDLEMTHAVEDLEMTHAVESLLSW